jgi:deoxyribonuclease V
VPEWPDTPEALIAAQAALAAERPEPWQPPERPRVAGCFVCFPSDEPGPGGVGDTAWAAAAAPPEIATAVGTTRGEYRAGLLALRAGPVLEAAVAGLPTKPDVLIVDATGRDHPRRAGLAVQLGAQLDMPTIGVTHRTLLAEGEWPPPERGAYAPIRLDGEIVGAWLRIQPRARPIAVHAGWRTDAETAVAIVMSIASRVRTPEPLRAARRAARLERAKHIAFRPPSSQARTSGDVTEAAAAAGPTASASEPPRRT